jgi:hypothetical protein
MISYYIENKLKVLHILEEIPTELNILISYKSTTLEHSALLKALRNILLKFMINSNYSQLLAHTLNLGNFYEMYESIEIEIILTNSILKTFLIWSSYTYTNFGDYEKKNDFNNKECYYIPDQISVNSGQISGNLDNYQSDCLISLQYMADKESINDVYRFQTIVDIYKYSLKMLLRLLKTEKIINSSKYYEIFEIVILCLKLFNEFLLISSPVSAPVGLAQTVYEMSYAIVDAWDFALFVDDGSGSGNTKCIHVHVCV